MSIELRNGQELVRLLCELAPQTESGRLPAWIHILPAGKEVQARDGRRFSVQDAGAIASASELPLLIDFEHRSESGDTKAAGWLEQLELAEHEPSPFPRPGLWGRCAWTAQGRADIEARNYRYISPVLLGRRHGKVLHVEKIGSIGLTNRPALALHQLEAFREKLSERFGSPFVERPAVADAAVLRGIDRAALRAHGVSDELALEVATELYGEKPEPSIDRAALRHLGLTDAEITEAERF